MSFTSVVEARANSGSVFLTPSKRKRPSPAPNTLLPASIDEIFKWIFTPAAVAPCFICDIRTMKRQTEKSQVDFWWLKRVPCRSVKIVGMVVGVQTYERRILYLVDDGTAVIECVHKCGAPPPPSPTKAGKAKASDPMLPKPVAWIGDTIEVVGRIEEFKYEQARRQLLVQEIVRCKSVNEKLDHWQLVLNLHDTTYSLSQPFTIPAPQIPSPKQIPSSASSSSQRSESSPPASASSSPASSTPAKPGSPIRLRHPSRLHTVDLNAITFRIYIKHYLDTALKLIDSDTESDYSDDDAGPSTPTRRPRLTDQTPRRRTSFSVDETPRPARRPILHTIESSESCSSKKGFTLSYLRRVPELSEMARRIVKAQAKRRDREERKKMKEAAATQRRGGRSDERASKSQPSASSTSTSTSISLVGQLKRVWQTAIIELLQEGSIVLWDGPTYAISSDPFDYSMHNQQRLLSNFIVLRGRRLFI
ncbi:hypothetical protein BT96DRAFT_851400 [Gymnopus androsaceus JB14]|uniref:CST complex subunit STN1 n=1 Tax=Gymnopus androsaceus JB14 TaxID=1447944 RepID=A0A6A4IBT8_9AGAR|nr:hypothetical protein BT96DRAFT_851400 [Gymnopus androsaceus JB14]